MVFEMKMMEDGTFDKILYRPLDEIMSILKHDNETIDLLKLDIENYEWDVLERSIFKVRFFLF